MKGDYENNEETGFCSSLVSTGERKGHIRKINFSHKQAHRLLGEKLVLKNLSWDDIPEFAVLTSQNGAGKSQLLQILYKVLKENHSGIIVQYDNDCTKSSNNPQKATLNRLRLTRISERS